MTENDKVLDIEGVHAELGTLGFDYTLRKVRYMATTKKLPFFVGPDGRRLYMQRGVLHEWVRKRQRTAVENCH